MKYLSHAAKLVCCHGGKVKPKPADGRPLRIKREPILCEKDLKDAEVENCPLNGPGLKKCDKVVSLLLGRSRLVRAGGEIPLLQTVLALTDSNPPGICFAPDDAGSVMRIHTGPGGSGQVADAPGRPEKPYRPGKGDTSWIEVHLGDEAGTALAGEWMRLYLPGGTILDCRLEADGKKWLEHLPKGDCTAEFPDLLVPHVVVRGDTLSGIAKRYYGDPSCWRRIWDHPSNQNFRKVHRDDPDVIHPGAVLLVPRPRWRELKTSQAHALTVKRREAHSVEIAIAQPGGAFDAEGNKLKQARGGCWYLADNPKEISFPSLGGFKPELLPVNPNRTYRLLLARCESAAVEQYETEERLRGDMKCWFGRFYSMAIHHGLTLVKVGRYRYPHTKLRELLAAYGGYKTNLEHWLSGRAHAVEPNWDRAFRAAERLNGPRGRNPGAADLGRALLPSLEAHLRFDLPRVIAHTFHEECGPVPGATLDAFRPDLDAMLSAYQDALGDLTREVDPGTAEGSWPLLNLQSERGSVWQKATSINLDWSRPPSKVQSQLRAAVVPPGEALSVAGAEVISYDWLRRPTGSPPSRGGDARPGGVRVPLGWFDPSNHFRLVRDEGGYDQERPARQAARAGDRLVLRFDGLVPSGTYSLYHHPNRSGPVVVIFSKVKYSDLKASRA